MCRLQYLQLHINQWKIRTLSHQSFAIHKSWCVNRNVYMYYTFLHPTKTQWMSSNGWVYLFYNSANIGCLLQAAVNSGFKGLLGYSANEEVLEVPQTSNNDSNRLQQWLWTEWGGSGKNRKATRRTNVDRWQKLDIPLHQYWDNQNYTFTISVISALIIAEGLIMIILNENHSILLTPRNPINTKYQCLNMHVTL